MKTLVLSLILAASAARATDVPRGEAGLPAVAVPVNVPTASASTTNGHEPTIKQRTHAAAVVGITAAATNLVGYSALMAAAFVGAGYLGTAALLVPIIGMPIVLAAAVYIAGTFVTDAPGSLADVGGALLGHYVGLALGLVSGVGAGLALQAVNKAPSQGNDFNVNALSFGGAGALVGAALGGSVGSAMGAGLVGALTVDTE
jgi:hypothetical protein